MIEMVEVESEVNPAAEVATSLAYVSRAIVLVVHTAVEGVETSEAITLDELQEALVRILDGGLDYIEEDDLDYLRYASLLIDHVQKNHLLPKEHMDVTPV